MNEFEQVLRVALNAANKRRAATSSHFQAAVFKDVHTVHLLDKREDKLPQ